MDVPFARGAGALTPPGASTQPSPAVLTAEEDHEVLKKLLNITSLRPGRNGSNSQATNYASYDEAKANPLPKLPDPLVLKNGQKVTTAAMWWNQLRAEIVEDFDREIYGRMPEATPSVKWQVTSTTSARRSSGSAMTWAWSQAFASACW